MTGTPDSLTNTPVAPVVGIDLGGTNMQVGVVAPDGRVLGAARKKTRSTEGRGPVLDRLVDAIGEACADAGIERAQVRAIGIGAPGAIDPARGVVIEAVNLRWNDVPLADELRERTGLPVVVDNDVNVGLYGEWKMGAAQGATDLLGVWVGTGIGGALVLNNALYHGAMFTAGEIGHTTLYPNAPLGSRSLEQNCSRTAVANRLRRLVLSNEPSTLSERIVSSDTPLKSKAIASAYADQDPLTVTVINEVADLIGTSIAGVVTLLSIPKVVLGGGLTEAAGQPFVDQVATSVRTHVFPDRCRAVEVVASRLEDDAGVVGAAMLASEQY